MSLSFDSINNNEARLTFTGRVRSVRCAFNGIRLMIASQHNAWVHAAVTVFALCAGIGFRLAASE